MQIHIMLPIIRSISKNNNLETDAEYEFEIPFYSQFLIQLLSAPDNRNILEIVWYFVNDLKSDIALILLLLLMRDEICQFSRLLAIFLLMKDTIELLLKMTLEFSKKLFFLILIQQIKLFQKCLSTFSL
jgi:hypothetical protein